MTSNGRVPQISNVKYLSNTGWIFPILNLSLFDQTKLYNLHWMTTSNILAIPGVSILNCLRDAIIKEKPVKSGFLQLLAGFTLGNKA